MSDSAPPVREWLLYVSDMIEFAEKVLTYTEGMNQLSFTDSGISYDAVLRNLELIGEAATHIPETVRQSHSNIPWRRVIATRNRLIHAYLGIDNDIIWSIICDDIPPLLTELKQIKQDPPHK